ncbi:hypothetical protein ACWDRR_42600 [Kitasatospora sp. NPDC003701]
MTTKSAWLLPRSGAGGQTREDTRLAPLGTMTPAGTLTTRPGVVPGGGYAVTGSGMTATVPTGRGIVQGTTTQGPIPVVTTAAETITIPDGTGQPRIDLIVIKVYESIYDASGLTLARAERVAGTPGTTPVVPAVPPTSIVLAQILVPGDASAGKPIAWGTALTDRRQYTSSIGGINPDGATGGVHDRQYRDGGKAAGLERYDGTSWESRLYLGPAGRVVIGTDTALYRGGTGVVKTDGTVHAAGMASGYTEDTTSNVIVNTTYASTNPTMAVTATAPPSGRLQIFGTVRQDINAGHFVFSSFQVSGSVSGTLRAPSDMVSVLTGSDTLYSQAAGSLVAMVIGASPGETVTATWTHKVDGAGGAANIYARALGLTPQLG